MTLIKLGAIGSTNDYLKELSGRQVVENFTTVTAENQMKGRGQMGSHWNSETGKNLIMSILIKDFLCDIQKIFELNILVSVAVIDTLAELNVPRLSLKWPNDIMSDDKKIGGVLIENSIKSDGSIQSVVGLGLNVNQVDFENLPKATSLAKICHTEFDREVLLFAIVEKIKNFAARWSKTSETLWDSYVNMLFKKGIPMPFEDAYANQFMGIITGITSYGKLEILRENGLLSDFDNKEIKMLY